MAIAPFRIGALQIPDNQPRAVPLDYRPLHDLGNTIAEYRSKQALAGILQQATDDKGNIDFNRAGTLLAQNGMTDRAREMMSIALQKEAGGRANAAAGRAEANQSFEQDIARRNLALKERALDAGNTKEHVVVDPYTDETTIVRSNNRDPGQVIYRSGAPAARGRAPGPQGALAPARARAPGPQSALEPEPGTPASFNDRFAALRGVEDAGAPETARYAAAGVPPQFPIPAQTPGGTPNEPIASDPPRRVAQVEPVIDEAGREIRPTIKTLRDETAKKQVANQEDVFKSAQAAADLKPHVDKLVEAWTELEKMKGTTEGIGPVVGSEYGRVPAALLKTKSESLRQQYETALSAVKARIVGAQNKGQGTVSNFERQLYGAQFPALTASDPATQTPFLTQLQESTNATIAAGRKTPFAGDQSAILDRPKIGGESAKSKIDPETLGALQANPVAALARAKNALDKGAPPAAVKQILEEIRPGLSRRLGL